MYLSSSLTVTMTDVKVTSSSSTVSGGFVYATEPGTSTLNINIVMSSAAVTNGYANLASVNGGAFYFNGVHVSLTIAGFSTAAPIQFSTMSASTSGAFLYSSNSLNLALTYVNIQTAIAQSNGGLMYINNCQSIALTHATITGVSSVAGMGGLMYISSSASSLNTVSIANSAVTNTQSALSGSMIYS